MSDDIGYFQFGADINCYGRSCTGTRQARPQPALYNLIEHAGLNDGRVKLPFDPTEVIDNLRLERYVAGQSAMQRLLRRLYYLVRPLATPFFRRRVQQFNAWNWSKISFPQWPVDTTVETLCERLLFYSLKAKDVELRPIRVGSGRMEPAVA